MTKPLGWLRGIYFAVALYLGSTLTTGDLIVRFGVAIVLFFFIPAAFYALTHRSKGVPDA